MSDAREPPDLGSLDSTRWRRIEAVLDQALELDAAELEGFLEGACAGDPALRAEVESLLAADRSAGRFLDRPAIERVPELFVEADEPAGQGLAEGARVGPWRVVRELGRGGMGVVYLAERADGAFERRVALKRVKRGLDTDEILARFVRERQILARLEHPHIARLLDGGASEDGRPYFVMEYVEGEPITAWCDARAVPVEERVARFLAVCAAVQYAHRSLVVHRDLKPSNILVTPGGEAKLLDFGIARLLDDQGAEGVATMALAARIMTPQYAAPEQIRGEPATTATDVYALGLVLHELLVGRRPYRLPAGSQAEIERALLTAESETPSRAATVGEDGDAAERARRRGTTPERLRRMLGGDLDVVVLTALRKEPERRYASVEALATDLERWRSQRPIHARPAGRGYRLAKAIRRNRLAFAAAAVGVAVLIGWGATMAVMLGRQQRERARAEAAARRAERVQEFLTDMLAAGGPERIASGLEVRGSAEPDLTVREALDRAAENVETKLAGEPEVMAAVHLALAESYLALQNWDRVEAHARAAAAGFERLDDAETRGNALSLLATALDRQGKAEEALPLVERVVAEKRRSGKGGRSLAIDLQNLAAIHNRLGRYDDAERAVGEGLAIVRALPNPDPAAEAELLNSLWNTRNVQGRYPEAESLQREALARVRATYGDDSPRTAISLNNLATTIYSQDRWAEAESLHRLVLAIRRRHLPRDHPQLTATINNLAMTLRNQHHYAEAESLFAEAIALRTASLGPEHRDVLVSRSGLANLWKEQGRLANAEAEHRAVLSIRRRTLKPEDPLIASSLLSLGETLALRKRGAEAERCLREALERRERILPAGHPDVAKVREALARLYDAEGKRALAARIRGGGS